jgi:hypothetical protein
MYEQYEFVDSNPISNNQSGCKYNLVFKST